MCFCTSGNEWLEQNWEQGSPADWGPGPPAVRDPPIDFPMGLTGLSSSEGCERMGARPRLWLMLSDEGLELTFWERSMLSRS